ncbi:hypothetical protein MMC29_000239 [Sticta canariensis]|nr:hypothetical protein [Sticta canariensis]
MSEASLDSQETVGIPEYLESLETFKFLEFNENAAQALWQLYCQMLRDDPERCDLLKMAKYHITSTPSDAGQERDEWVGHMDRIGLTKSFQARLMAPEAQEMRDVASANEWAILMITMRFEFLECLDDIRTPPRGVERPASRITPSGELWRISEAGPSTAVKPPPPEEMEGCRMFYTEVAWKYAQWAAQVVDRNVVPVGILQVAIPIPLLASSYELVGSDWRIYVWKSRYEEDAPPQTLAFVIEIQWIVGPVCMQGQHNIKKMKDASELKMWRFGNGQVAHQL